MVLIPTQGIVLDTGGNTMTTTATYTVTGMTCGHCVASVKEEVGAIEGVETVDVQLEGGRLTVTGDVTADAVKAAVEEAGYEVTS
jgi:copper chaperone